MSYSEDEKGVAFRLLLLSIGAAVLIVACLGIVVGAIPAGLAVYAGLRLFIGAIR